MIIPGGRESGTYERIRTVHKISVRKSEGKRSLGIFSSRRKHNNRSILKNTI
jgi:hypothetical protein